MTDTNSLLRELANNVARKARTWQKIDPERGLAEVAASIENWLRFRAPMLPGFSPDWQDSPDGAKAYSFPDEERDEDDADAQGDALKLWELAQQIAQVRAEEDGHWEELISLKKTLEEQVKNLKGSL